MQKGLRILVPKFPHEALNKLPFDTLILGIKKLPAPPIEEVFLEPLFLKGLLAFAIKNPWGQAADASASTFSAATFSTEADAVRTRFPRLGGA